MTQKIEYVTAESERGRLAIEEVMQHSYGRGIDEPNPWAIARIVDSVPVSFIIINPDGRMEFPYGEIVYAFIRDVATREDRRLEGHFRGIMEYVFSKLRAVGIPLVLTHGEYQLYPRFGFDVYTHHCGIFVTPELIERKLGTQVFDGARELLKVSSGKFRQTDLLIVDEAKAGTFPECKAVLQAAAAIARERCKARILLWQPEVHGYRSSYPPQSNLTTMARACGAQICIRGAEPEGDEDHGDWIKALNIPLLMREALKRLKQSESPLPKGVICFLTDAGTVTIGSSGSSVIVLEGAKSGALTLKWPSSAIAQLVTGYHSASVLCAIHDSHPSKEAMALLEALFPQQWRFSGNENWFF